jgi:regulator of protease activity HflC (stomatin/prohibitin superfamily)
MWLSVSTILAAAVTFVLSGGWHSRLFAAGHVSDAVGPVIGALLLAALGFVSCLYMAFARRRAVLVRCAGKSSPRHVDGWVLTAVTVVFSGCTTYVVLSAWPLSHMTPDVMTTPNGFMVASGMLLLATPWLLMERYLRTVSTKQLPEVDDLRALTFLPVFFLTAEAALQVATGLGLGLPHWLHAILAALVLMICTELCARAAAIWFQPPRDSVDTQAPIGSLVAGMLHGRSLSPARMAAIVRSEFGMDFSRSWALHFVRSAALPVTLVLLAFCWFLTGVTRVDLNERGSYERLGVPVAMLRPGLHLVLPWPFGAVRHVELGVVHVVPINYADHGITPDPVDQSTAEGMAPASANRLWDSEQPSDVSYIIASGDQNRQSFQTVSVSASVLFRIGLTDAAAMGALYRAPDPGSLVYSLAGRLLAQFFASQTLPSVLGESQGEIASDLKARLQVALDQLGSGIEVVAVTIEAIHPPSGAASAYRSVQAAQIAASTAISSEQGRARTTQSVARLNAHNATDDATAVAAETVSSAQIDLTNMAADMDPYHAASQPFLLERYFSNVKAALKDVSLEIVDHRLTGMDRPTIDLRPTGALRDVSPTRTGRAEAKP